MVQHSVDKLNIGRGITLCPVGGKSYKADVMLSTPPDSETLKGEDVDIMLCKNLQRINIYCWEVLKLLSSERVELNNRYFYKKFLYMIESNALGTYPEAKREIGGQISTITSNKSVYAIETAICCLEGILLIFSDIPKKIIEIESDIEMLENLQDTLYEVPIEQFQINSRKIREIEKSIDILENYKSFQSNYNDFRKFAYDKVNEMIKIIE